MTLANYKIRHYYSSTFQVKLTIKSCQQLGTLNAFHANTGSPFLQHGGGIPIKESPPS
jgi:hypothetical protein